LRRGRASREKEGKHGRTVCNVSMAFIGDGKAQDILVLKAHYAVVALVRGLVAVIVDGRFVWLYIVVDTS
jgi:hypothetical protein